MISPEHAVQHIYFCRRVAATTTIHLFNRFREIRYKDGHGADLKAMFDDDLRAAEYSGLVLKDADFLKSCLENWVKALCISMGASPIRSNTTVILKRFFKRLCVIYNCSHTKGATYDHERVLSTLEDCVYLRIKGILDSRAKKSVRAAAIEASRPVLYKESLKAIPEQKTTAEQNTAIAHPRAILQRTHQEPGRVPVRQKGREPQGQEMKHRKPSSSGRGKKDAVPRPNGDEFVITLS